MEARSEATGVHADRDSESRTWPAAVLPIALLGLLVLLFALLGAPGLDDRRGPPVEELAVERTELRPGEIELSVRNPGPDPVTVAQVAVNEQFVDFDTDGDTIGRLESGRLTLAYPWIEGSPYGIEILTNTGATISHEIDIAVETPATDSGFFGLMALIGTYVGIIPVVMGMLFLPFLRRIREQWMRFFMALTIGLLAFLAVDAYLEGLELGGQSAGAFGGAELLFLGAGLAYLGLTATDRWLRGRRERAGEAGSGAFSLSLMVAIGIGLHNLGEGLAIGSAYSIGAVGLGAFLVIGFALHNTTEGLAIVAPLARAGERPPLGRLLGLGLIAGAPAIAGAVIGAAAFNAELSALLIGIGIGAIVQVIQQLVPAIRDDRGQALQPTSVGGILAGVVILYGTGLLIAV